MNLTDGRTSPEALIKRAKFGFNQKIKFPHDTNQHIQEIVINNGFNTHIVQMLCEICEGDFIFERKFLRD